MKLSLHRGRKAERRSCPGPNTSVTFPRESHASQGYADVRLSWATGPDYGPVDCLSRGTEVLTVSHPGKMLMQRRKTRARP